MKKIHYENSNNQNLCGILTESNNTDKIVIMCHGIRGNKDECGAFIKLSEELLKIGYSSFRFDFNGHGESDGLDKDMTITKEISDLETTVNMLQEKGYKEIVLLGGSFGAGIVSLFPFEKYNNVKAIVLWYGCLDYEYARFGNLFTEENMKQAEKDEKYLRQISKEVDFNDISYKEEIVLLENFCLDRGSLALAAIQIGIPKRMVFIRNTDLDELENREHNESRILINPVIISRKGHTKYWEACASCLDYMGLVNRPYEVVIEYFDMDGVKHREKFEGFESTVLSHELDHLDGILHMDIAEEILNMPKDERKKFRKEHPYEIISKTCNYNSKTKKLVNKRS